MPLPELPQPAPVDLSDIPPAQERSALVIDFPGPQSVFAGLAMAERGYRPVPLYNACPPPPDYPPQSRQAVVDMDSILAALVRGADSREQEHAREQACEKPLTPYHCVPPCPCSSGKGAFSNTRVLKPSTRAADSVAVREPNQ